MALAALIVDDEAIARRRLRRLLLEHPDVQVIAECASGRDAVALLNAHHVDVVFLDIQMPGVGGFRVLRAVNEPHPYVVFVTAYPDYAVDAFDVRAVDYLVKPVGPDRLASALAHIRTLVASKEEVQSSRRLRALLSQALESAPKTIAPSATFDAARVERFRIRQGGRVLLVRLADIDWFEASGNTVKAHIGTDAHTFRGSINHLERTLDQERFVRIHRSTIVQFDRIREFRPGLAGDGIIVLIDGTRLRMSRSYRDKLRGRLHLL